MGAAKKNPAAVSLGRLGGLASAAALTITERTARAQKAAAARHTRRGWPKGTPRGPRKTVTP